jgi:hypothetical protein
MAAHITQEQHMTAKAPAKRAFTAPAPTPKEPSTTIHASTFTAGSRLKSFNMDVALMAAVDAKLAAQRASAFVPPKGEVKVSPAVATKLAKATSKEERYSIMLRDHYKVDPSQRPMTFTALVHELLTEWLERKP